MDSITFVERLPKLEPRPVYALHGDEDFLKRQALAAMKRHLVGAEDDAFGLGTYPGDKAEFAAIRDELDTVPFLSPRRLVIVENADPFVTRFRALLEKYVAEPAPRGVLVLDVKTWPANTRLAKLLDNEATIVCKTPAVARLPEWCARWAEAQYGKQLAAPAARLLVDLVGPEMGLLDQELAKLAVYVGKANKIDSADVDRLVGNSRAENTWKIFDAIGAGQTKEALHILDRLCDQGEEPLRMLGAFSMQLRRLAQVSRLTQLGRPAGVALDQAGIPPWARQQAEQQLRHLGRRRLDRVFDWLLEVDQGLKGSSQLPPRMLLERLVIQLARKP